MSFVKYNIGISYKSFVKFIPGTPVLFTLLYSKKSAVFSNKPENIINFTAQFKKFLRGARNKYHPVK